MTSRRAKYLQHQLSGKMMVRMSRRQAKRISIEPPVVSTCTYARNVHATVVPKSVREMCTRQRLEM